MTLTIIFGIAIVLGIGLVLLKKIDKFYYSSWNITFGWVLILVGGIIFAINLLCWLPSNKDSQIKYNQLISEKASIEAMLETDKTVDRFLLNSSVINYNNKIISIKLNHTRFIYKDYYDLTLDWNSLETIEWK